MALSSGRLRRLTAVSAALIGFWLALGTLGVLPQVMLGLALGASVGVLNARHLAARVLRLGDAFESGGGVRFGLGLGFRLATAALGAAIAANSGGALDVRAYAAGLFGVSLLIFGGVALGGQRR
ncbi:MAG: ATP synthase subunit I [Hydrogenibacillus sp.]|nr:ATP synthase subunit I [Hydrogenibacillus sp.]